MNLFKNKSSATLYLSVLIIVKLLYTLLLIGPFVFANYNENQNFLSLQSALGEKLIIVLILDLFMLSHLYNIIMKLIAKNSAQQKDAPENMS